MYKVGIITAVKGYKIKDLLPFLTTFYSISTSSELFLIMYDYRDEELELLKKMANNFSQKTYIYTSESNSFQISVKRYQEFLEIANKHPEIDYWCQVDVRDSYFQWDPGEWILSKIKDYSIIASGEGVTHWNEDWNGGGLQYYFGDNFWNRLKDKEALCAGVWAAHKSKWNNICSDIIEYSIYSKDPFGNYDQQLFNILIYEKYFKDTLIASLDQDFAVNLGCAYALPNFNPKWSNGNKCERYGYARENRELSEFKDALLYDQIIITNDHKKIIKNSYEKPFSIVHQYDRIPQLKKSIFEKIEETFKN
jgi:hypothetical protein